MRPRQLRLHLLAHRLLLVAALAVLGALAAAGPAAASPAACTDSWTGQGTDALWSDAANWSTGVPQASDTVCIGSGATVELDAAADGPTVTGLELDGATITTDGSETLTVSGELDLQADGSQDPDALGSGLTLTAQGTTTVDPDLDVCLAGSAQLQNSGTLTLGAGSDLGSSGVSACASDGGAVTNLAGGTVDAPSGATVATDSFDNQGAVDVGAGTLTVGAPAAAPGQDATGTWTAASGATLDLTAGQPLTNGLSGQGTLEVSAGTTTIGSSSANGSLSLNAISVQGGTLEAEQPLGVSSLTVAAGATLQGPGAVTVASTLAFTGTSGQVALQDLALTSDGSASVGSDVDVCADARTTIANGGTLSLGSGADLGASDTAECDDPDGPADPGNGQVTNESGGSIAAGAGSELASSSFDNLGSVTVATGTLSIPASSSANGPGDTGTYAVDSGATLNLTGTDRYIDYGGSSGGTFSGGGTLDISSGTTEFGSTTDLSSLSHFNVGDTQGTPSGDGAVAQVDASLTAPTSTAIAGDLDGWDGSVAVPAHSSLSLLGPDAQLGQGIVLTNSGTLAVGSTARACIDAYATLENEGTLTLVSGAVLGASPGNSNCNPSGTLINDPGATITSAGGTMEVGTFDDEGSLALTSGTLVLSGTYEDQPVGYTVSGQLSGSAGALALTAGAEVELTPQASGSIHALSVASGTTLQLDADASTPLVGSAANPITPNLSVTQATLDGVIGFDGDALPPPSTEQPFDLLHFGASTGTPQSFPADDNGWSASLAPANTDENDIVFTPPPSNTAPPSITGTAEVGDTLTVKPGTWSTWTGYPKAALSEQWEDCDPSGDCTPITGATGTTYNPTDNDVGDQIEVLETASNAGGSNTATSAMTAAVSDPSSGGGSSSGGGNTGAGNTGGGPSGTGGSTGSGGSSSPSGGGSSGAGGSPGGSGGANANPAAPQNLASPSFTGDDGEVGETLTEVPGQWSNNPSTVTLQWYDCDITGMNCTAIAGATGPTYTTTESDDNASIVVVETATNAAGSTQAASEPSSMVLDLGDFGLDGGGPSGGGKSGDGKSGGKDGDNGGSNGSSGSGGGSSGAAATVSLRSHAASGTAIAVGLRCPHRASCPVVLTLSATRSTAGAPNARSRRTHGSREGSRVVVVGSQTAMVRAGGHRTVTVTLNRVGQKMLTGDRKLRTVLTARSRSRTLATTRVTFTAPASRRGRHRR